MALRLKFNAGSFYVWRPPLGGAAVALRSSRALDLPIR
jgi:hypothetical protein